MLDGTQALLDLFTIDRHFKGNIKGKKIAIVGDIKNSRVANSNIELLNRAGLDLMGGCSSSLFAKNRPKKSYDIKEVINEVDIIMSLRTQTERHGNQILLVH